MSSPNILVVLADDLGYGDLGCTGSPVIQTPHLDRFASQGIQFNQCYAASPNCSPARAGLLTGRTPYRVGMYDFLRKDTPMHLPADEITVASMLRDNGYDTCFVGKWHLSGYFNDHPNPGQHGFNHWLANAGNFDQNPTTLLRNGKPAGELPGIQCEVVMREAIDWLENIRDKKKPFCLFVWLNEPHTPVRATDEFKERYRDCEETASKVRYGGPGVDRSNCDKTERPTYFGCVSQMDNEFGRLMDTLDRLGLAEDTFAYFTSDNGPEHRAPTSWGSPGNFRGAKGHMHEGGIHVPGFMRWPAKFQAGTISELPINGTDLLPTLCALSDTSITATKPIDGVNLLPALLEGEPLDRQSPLFWWLFHARGEKQACLREGDWKIMARMNPQGLQNGYGNNPPPDMTYMDYIKTAPLEDFELFNLAEDPEETTNRANNETELMNHLQNTISTLHNDVRNEGPRWETITGPIGK
ncbi:MAG: sulfatase-like hydrolase/transferase [Candidatus Latescibacteria bacterium]|jgi:arylsulfatase A|nr:sulfatase-like hydrolase/transferase [Candidatus Latescibacterota bacterium]